MTQDEKDILFEIRDSLEKSHSQRSSGFKKVSVDIQKIKDSFNERILPLEIDFKERKDKAKVNTYVWIAVVAIYTLILLSKDISEIRAMIGL